MPVHSERRGDKWVVVDNKGKVHGTHRTKDDAVSQVKAMNISMGYVPGVKPKEEKK